jgi:hypothetical protein
VSVPTYDKTQTIERVSLSGSVIEDEEKFVVVLLVVLGFMRKKIS